MSKVITGPEVRTTRKKRHCELCGGEINAGEKYTTAVLVDNGIVWHTCEHPHCHAILEKGCDACDETCRDECFVFDCFAHAIECFVCPLCVVAKECKIEKRWKCNDAMEIAKRCYGKVNARGE